MIENKIFVRLTFTQLLCSTHRFRFIRMQQIIILVPYAVLEYSDILTLSFCRRPKLLYWIQSKNLTTAYLLQVEKTFIVFHCLELNFNQTFLRLFFQITLALHFTSTSHIHSTFPMKVRECVHKSNFQRLYGFFLFPRCWLRARALRVANTWPSHYERVQVPHLLSGYIQSLLTTHSRRRLPAALMSHYLYILYRTLQVLGM